MNTAVDIAVAEYEMSKARFRNTANNKVGSAATPFARQLRAILRRWGHAEIRRLMRGGDLAVRKAARDGDLEAELEALMIRFGVKQFADAAERGANAVGASWDTTPEILAEVIRDKQQKVVLLADETRALARESVRNIVGQAVLEVPRPTAAELGRRLARSWFGPPRRADGPGDRLGRDGELEGNLTADWRRDTPEPGTLRPGEHEYLFSFDRAATIARTELSQVENAGTARGLSDAGVEKVKWNSPGNDGRSGKRRHYLMNRHKPITVVAMNGSDRSKWFKLPSGSRAPYPNWIGLPASDAVN